MFITVFKTARHLFIAICSLFNPLTPNDHYSGRTAPLTCNRCMLYIYSTNIGTEYFKHGIYSPFPLDPLPQNAVCFIILTYLVPVLFTFYIQDVLKLKKNNSGAKRLIKVKSCNILLRLLPVGIRSFLISVLSYTLLLFG